MAGLSSAANADTAIRPRSAVAPSNLRIIVYSLFFDRLIKPWGR
jgi:hypothetical protein